jgi:hypothetical protein
MYVKQRTTVSDVVHIFLNRIFPLIWSLVSQQIRLDPELSRYSLGSVMGGCKTLLRRILHVVLVMTWDG